MMMMSKKTFLSSPNTNNTIHHPLLVLKALGVVVLVMLLLHWTTSLVPPLHRADAATPTLVSCPGGEITTVVVLDGGLEYELYDCKVHGAGQIVVNGTAGASLRLERVQLTDPDGDYSVWVDGTSVAVRLTATNSFVNSSAGLNEGNIVVWNASQSGNVVEISNNIFGGRASVVFASNFKLDATSSITITDNDLSRVEQGAAPSLPRYSFSWHLWVYIHEMGMSGGTLTMSRNNLYTSSSMDAANANGMVVPVRNYSKLSNVGLLRIETYVIEASATAATFDVEYNYGFYPLVIVYMGTIAPTVHSFNINHNAGNFLDCRHNTYFVSIGSFSANPSTPCTDIITNVINNTVDILWALAGQQAGLTFVTLFGLKTTKALIQNNHFNSSFGPDFDRYSDCNFVSMRDGYDEVRMLNNSFYAVLKSGYTSRYTGAVINEVLKATFSHNTISLSNVTESTIVDFEQLLTGDNLNSSYLRITHNNVIVVADHIAVAASANRVDFLELYYDLEFKYGLELYITDNVYGFTSLTMSSGMPMNSRRFKELRQGGPVVPYILITPDLIGINRLDTPAAGSPLLDVSRNVLGSTQVCDYGTDMLFPDILGDAISTLTTTGCYNWICGTRVADLAANYTGVNWTSCVTPSESLLPTPTQSLPSTHSKSHTKIPAPVTEVSTKKNIVRFQPTKASVPVEVSGTVIGAVVVTTVASGPLVEGVPALQVWALYSLMSCQIDGEQPSTAKRLLAPLTFTDFESADLIGSLTLVIGGSLLYYAIAHIVFAIVRKCTPTTDAPTVDQSVEEWDEQQWVLERRMQRAKLLLLYPRVPVLLVIVLFTGITYDSCRLLYGSAKDTAAVWERVLGGVCLAAAVLFVLYHAWAGWRVHRMVQAESKTHDDDDERRPLSPRDNHLTGPISAQESEGQMASFSRSHSATSSSHPRAASHLVSPRDVAEDGGSDVLEMPAVVPSSRWSPQRTAASPHHEFNSPLSMSPVGDDPLQQPDDPLRVLSPLNDEVSINTFVPPLDLPPSKKTTDVDDEANAEVPLKTTTSTNPNDEEVWSVFKPEEKEMFPVVIATTLCASGKWSIAISRSRYCVVTAMRPEFTGCLCMTSSCLTRSAAVSIAAAVAATDQAGCDAVYSSLAAISFIHALFLLIFRPYRIPALNPLNALQSVLLGLLACTQFMGSETAQIVLSVLFMIACVVTIVVCAVSTFLDFLINRRRAKIAQEKSGGLTFRAENHMDI